MQQAPGLVHFELVCFKTIKIRCILLELIFIFLDSIENKRITYKLTKAQRAFNKFCKVFAGVNILIKSTKNNRSCLIFPILEQNSTFVNAFWHYFKVESCVRKIV